MALRGSAGRLRDTDKIVLQLTLPNFQAYLLIDYFSSDGSVLHMVADTGASLQINPGTAWKALAPSHSDRPGSVVTFGEPNKRIDFPGWEVGPPFGTDMISAIASSLPLLTAPRPADPAKDSSAAYLRDLQAAIDIARSRGARFAGQALLVETVRR